MRRYPAGFPRILHAKYLSIIGQLTGPYYLRCSSIDFLPTYTIGPWFDLHITEVMSSEGAYIAPELVTLDALPLDDDQSVGVVALGLDPPSDVRLSHASFRRCTARFSHKLIESQVERQGVIAIVLPNSAEFIASFLAVTAIARIAAPLNPKYTAEEFKFYLDDANVRLVLVEPGTPSDAPIAIAASALNIKLLALPTDLLGQTADEITYPSDSAPSPDEIALFLHTSGTTSRPKGVPLSHRNLCASVSNISNTYELKPSDTSLLVMPLFHVHGLMSATLSTLATGGTVALPPGGRFSAGVFWPSIVRCGATWFTAVPTIHQILLARAAEEYPVDNQPSLRFIRSCSASLAPAVLQRLEATFKAPVLEAYAMTEASHQMTSNPLPKYGDRRPGTVGVAQRVEVTILNEQNQAVPCGEVGEVCIRGINVTKGYQNNAAANETAFAGGWFHTGDQGQLDTEGYLTLTGRIKELVNRGGEKISPLEVDAVLLSHPAVTEAVSFAVPDEKYGEEVNAAVIFKQGMSVTESELSSFALDRLASFKVPKKFFICDDLPRTATGKIQRRIVSNHFVGSA